MCTSKLGSVIRNQIKDDEMGRVARMGRGDVFGWKARSKETARKT
jgi:hypothetical protein